MVREGPDLLTKAARWSPFVEEINGAWKTWALMPKPITPTLIGDMVVVVVVVLVEG